LYESSTNYTAIVIGIIFVQGVIFGCACAILANSKNRSIGGYFFLGFFLGIIGLLIAVGVPKLNEQESKDRKSTSYLWKNQYEDDKHEEPADVDAKVVPAVSTKECPFCAETIKYAAVVCRYCGRDLPERNASQ